MSYKIAQITSIEEMRQHVGEVKRGGNRIAFVPTMGYLHEGHMSLVDRAISLAEHVIVSIYVNSLQFGPHEDLESYPRNIDKDIRRLSDRGIGAVFLPSDKELYPGGYSTFVAVEGLTQSLCGRSRPTHFRGVTTVVTKLFNVVAPDYAVFGEKDYQQLAIIRRMVIDLNMDVDIISSPIIREDDGLAMSSRNACLSEEERESAPEVYGALCAARTRFRSGERSAEALLSSVKEEIESNGVLKLDYIELVDPVSLGNLAENEQLTLPDDVHLAIAVYVGKTRLIDNMRLSEP